MLLRSLSFGVLAVAYGSTAHAATISHEKLNATTELIWIYGEISSGDLERFRQISLKYPKAIVALNSDGGLIQPAIEIGKIIKIMGYLTAVDDDSVCASACALIWMAGSKKALAPNAHLGFHAGYRTENGKMVESGAANALVGNYLTLLGASARTVVFATSAPPNKILWLTAQNKEESGIDFRIISSDPQPKNGSQTPPPITTVTTPPPARVATPSYSSAAPIIAPPGTRAIQPTFPPSWEWSTEPSAPWVLTGETETQSKYYLNQETFKPFYYSKSGWQFWVKMDHSRDNTKIARETKVLFQVSCDQRTVREIHTITYDKYGRVLSSSSDSNYNSNPLEPVVPDSVGDTIFNNVCGR